MSLRMYPWMLLVGLALLAGSDTVRASSTWQTDFAVAQKQARAEGKLMLVHFSGSDWCGWCIKLRRDVFQKPEFKEYASNHLVLVTIDFPRRKTQLPAIQQANQELARRFQVEGFPTLAVVDGDGTKLGVMGFGDGGPKAFIKELEKVVERRKSLVAAPEPVRAIATSNKIAPRGGLYLQSISSHKTRPLARINNQLLATGQSAKVRVASGEVKIQCVEIRTASVLIRLDGRKEPLELKLADNL